MIELDLYAPPPVDPNWLGDVSLYLECASANLWNAWIGVQPIASAAAVQVLSFSPTPEMLQVLQGDHECRFKIALNAPTAAGTFVIDSLRFAP
jgi:hypothetical protein